MREYNALKLNELSTSALSRKPSGQSQRQNPPQMRQSPPNRSARQPQQNQYMGQNQSSQYGQPMRQPQQNQYMGQNQSSQYGQPMRQPQQNQYMGQNQPSQYGQPTRQSNQQVTPPIRSGQPVRQASNTQMYQTPPIQSGQPVRQTSQLHSSYTPPIQSNQPVRQSAPPTPPPMPKRPPLPPANKLLKKGEKFSITKNAPEATDLRIGIGWGFSGQTVYDVDIEAFMLDETEKVPDDSWIVFYGQLKSPDNAVIHRGDSSNGTNFGADCEQIDVDLKHINSHINKIAFVVTINEAKKFGYNFSGMKDAYIRISDIRTGKEIVRYELTDYYREVVSMVVGELYLRNGEWRFNPVGMGTDDDLEGLCNKYGIEVV